LPAKAASLALQWFHLPPGSGRGP